MKYNLEAITWKVYLQCYKLALPDTIIDENNLKDSCFRSEDANDGYLTGGNSFQFTIQSNGFFYCETLYNSNATSEIFSPCNVFQIQQLLEPFKISIS